MELRTWLGSTLGLDAAEWATPQVRKFKFDPTRKRVIVFSLDELVGQVARPGKHKVSKRIQQHPFYCMDERFSEDYDLGPEPDYPDEENKRGYAFFNELCLDLASQPATKHICQIQGGLVRWSFGWHNSLSKEEMIARFEAAGFEVFPFAFLFTEEG